MKEYYLISHSVSVNEVISKQKIGLPYPEVLTCIGVGKKTSVHGSEIFLVKKIDNLKSYLEDGSGVSDTILEIEKTDKTDICLIQSHSPSRSGTLKF